VRLQTGRLLVPFMKGDGNQWTMRHIPAACMLSDDGGRSWRLSRGEVRLPKRGAMEPSVAELAGGELVMSLRTQLGAVHFARSADGGETWSEPRASALQAPEACTCLRRVPGTNDLLLLWNNSRYQPKHHHSGDRTPLTAAVSGDGGRSWRVVGNLAAGPDDEYTNLGCTFTSQGKAVVTYMYTRPAFDRTRIHLRAVVVDPSWLAARV
jgi:sialidase-1